MDIPLERDAMATYALIHGAGDVGWYWHLVAAELRERGHDVVAPDLPCEDDSAGLADYADAVVDAIGDRADLVVVAQSFGGYTAPLVCERVPAELLVLVAGMVPAPGESAEEMFATTGYERAATGRSTTRSPIFYHDVAPELAAEALAPGARPGRGARQRAVAARPPGRTCRRATCCAATTASSPPSGPPRRPRAPRHRARRDRRRPLPGPQPPA